MFYVKKNYWKLPDFAAVVLLRVYGLIEKEKVKKKMFQSRDTTFYVRLPFVAKSVSLRTLNLSDSEKSHAL